MAHAAGAGAGAAGEDEPKDVTSNEEKELRRVYDHLANYYAKSKLQVAFGVTRMLAVQHGVEASFVDVNSHMHMHARPHAYICRHN